MAKKINTIENTTINYAMPTTAIAEMTTTDKDGITTTAFQYTSTDKDGVVSYHSTKSEIAISVIKGIEFWATMGKLSTKAVCIEISRITKEVATKEGYKSQAEMLHSIFPDLATNTINQYKKAGFFFGKRDIDEDGKVVYRWRNGIDDFVSVNNLTAVCSLLEYDGKDYEKLTDKEKDEIYAEFYKKYIESELIHLNNTQSKLKEELEQLKNTIDGTCKVVDEKKTDDNKTDDNKTDDNKTDDNKTDDTTTETAKESATKATTTLALIFKGNAKAEKLLTELMALVNEL